MSLTFEIFHRSTATSPLGSGRARVGVVTTPHGSFKTPAFMPVGTRGTVRGLLPQLVRDTGAEVVLGNTYHLMLRPGADAVERLGGLHAFMNWRGPILTDSGGYQAYSMADLNRLDDDGVTFKSIVDGSDVRLTPERAIQVQNQLGADIIMAFDDCPPSIDPEVNNSSDVEPRLRAAVKRDSSSVRRARPYDHAERLKVANERTVRWLERCKAEHGRERTGSPDPAPGTERRALFGIVQGGTDLVQRSWSAERICQIELPGYAIGGVAVGEGTDAIAQVVNHTAPLLPEHKPRYLMGVGYERDLLAAVRAGIDMFDCVLPTRNGRNACAFTPSGQLRLRNAKYAEDPRPLDPHCDCVACSGFCSTVGSAPGIGSPTGEGYDTPFSRAYIRHLFLAKEMLGPILVSLHNLRHFQRFMADLRSTILRDDWAAFLGRWPVAAAGCPEDFSPASASPESDARAG